MEDSKILLLLEKDVSQGLLAVTKKYGGLVKAITIKILSGCNEDVEECISDTFIALWKSKNRIDLNKGSLKAYLACIARNTAINRYNKLKREQSAYLAEDLGTEKSVEDMLAIKSDIQILYSLLKEMQEPAKQIFFRRFFMLEKIKEIAHSLGLKEKTVENKLFREKKKLKEKLIERGVIL